MKRSSSPAVALTIAGSDSSAGAGIQADLKTFSALGVYGVTAITCIVAETPGMVRNIEPISAAMVCAQMDVLLRHFPVAAIKTGLLCSREIVMVVAKNLRARSRPLVVDPVMVATSGDPLLRDDAIESYEKDLFPLAALITPNLDEASRLLGESIADLEGMRTAGVALQKKYDVPILLKGGHLTGAEAIDLLFVKGNVIQFSAPFARGLDTHGTGCTYSAAITAGLANGQPLEEAVRRAKKFVTSAITEHLHWTSAQTRLHALNHSPSNF